MTKNELKIMDTLDKGNYCLHGFQASYSDRCAVGRKVGLAVYQVVFYITQLIEKGYVNFTPDGFVHTSLLGEQILIYEGELVGI